MALFVKVTEKTTVVLEGSDFEESVPVQLENGWNLVGVDAQNDMYTAESFLDFCTSLGTVCDTVSTYDAGRYVNVVKAEGILYGNDYNLTNKRGYFVRVASGGGKELIP